MSGPAALATWLMRPGWLTDGEILAELRDLATGAERRADLDAEMGDRRKVRAALGQEARRAAARDGERAAARLGTAGRP